MEKTYVFTAEPTYEEYLMLEKQLVEDFLNEAGEFKLIQRNGTEGTVLDIECHGLFEAIYCKVAFADCTKQYQLKTALTSKFLHFNNETLLDIYNTYLNAHKELTAQWNVRAEQLRVEAKEAAKKAEAEQKAEAAYQAKKLKAETEFEAMTKEAKTFENPDEEFYYSLGWLAKHIGTLTAKLPDYLGSAFERHFGSETPKILIDSRAKTSGGYAKQWSWEFKCTMKKLKETVIPTCIQNVTTDFSKGIHNTAFLWDLVENYGFQFGKSQDVSKIAEQIPSQYLTAFNSGLTA